MVEKGFTVSTMRVVFIKFILGTKFLIFFKFNDFEFFDLF